ncbi:acetyl/propionyl/methylcrotonyl-CoA carboxylase subunit alpha [Alicyclobacillus sp. SP_1]|uniref:acetyl-CoA carboxylase biotin carboxylase subunit n=1 Tax=Alicyclobacillus sp. SP_1 TaxID=2942475 RepID=UPI002157D8E9|nr:biotin carboxylase N-terminal domain-containing protein [Alicyclobacillus sp. SP_1]
MVRKLFIANRGEIACRIQRTCKRLGIPTVAAYSDADKDALFVQQADESVHIGPPPVSASYLNIEAIVAGAVKTGADAIHPGYGLLSENADFAEAVRAAGLVFVGPPVEAMRAMANKVEARQRMQAAGLPIVPGSTGGVDSPEDAVLVANRIGYPIMLKASSGGGGIGMQIVRSDDELKKAFAGNSARAKSYFGDGQLFLEKYVEHPHHVEIQVFFDQMGNGIYLGDRECSIQRRHQKVVEEAPSPFVPTSLMETMGEAAVRAAASIGYVGAGTFEFLVDANLSYYFLEMNTRLQVEHPVTEQIAGVDLVEWQLAIASGQALPMRQSEVQLNGHSIEVRLYAEDPIRGLPSPGTLTRLDLPKDPAVRLEMGYRASDVVTPFYDPLLGKLVVTAETREGAVQLLQKALAQCRVEGIKTNLPRLVDIAKDPRFLEGVTTTDFLETMTLNDSVR